MPRKFIGKSFVNTVTGYFRRSLKSCDRVLPGPLIVSDVVSGVAGGKTESSRRRTLIAAGATIGGIFFRGVSSLVTVRLCLAFLGKEAFTVWVFIQNASGYFALSEAGVGQATLNEQGKAYVQDDFERMSRVLVSATGLYVGLVSVAALLALGVLFFVPLESWLPKEMSGSLLESVGPLLSISVALVLCAVPLTSFGATLSGARFHHVRQILDAFLPLFVLSTLAAVLMVDGGLRAAVMITPLSQIVWGGVYFVAVKKLVPELSMKFRHFSWPVARTMLGHSMFFFLIGFCLLGFRALPTLMVGRHGSVDDVSRVYSLVLLIRVLGWSVMDAVSRVVQPYIILFEHQGKRDRIEFFTRLGTVITSLSALLLVLVILCFGDRILEIWLRDHAPLAFGIIATLCISFLLDVALLPVFNTLVALNRHRRLGVMMAVQSGLMILFSELFARSGLWASPATAVLSGILFASFSAFVVAGPWVAAPGLGMSFGKFIRSILMRPLLLAGVAVVVVGILCATPNSMAMRTAVFSVACGMALLLTWRNILDIEEREFLFSLIKRRRR